VAKDKPPTKAPGKDTSRFGARLRRLRESAGLTQEELASRAGLTAKAISMLERGERRRPYPHTVRSLADALELSEEERAVLTGAILGRRGGTPVPNEAGSASPSALPTSLTSLLGREHEVEEVVGLLLGRDAALGAVRLLTLTGPGGIGKTRLGIEAARKAGTCFPEGVAFVALAPLGDSALVMPTVSQVLGLREAAGARPLEILCQYLRERRFLLVLDNFEHVAQAAPEVVDLLNSCPHLSVLVTSRAPLKVRGEREHPVSPLAVPAPARTPQAEEVAASPAAGLFIERAEEASGAFELTQANAAAVATICWRLDGLPLALELAAAQTRFLGPMALLSRLNQALQAGGARDFPHRQRTMRATLDWSHNLLHGPEKEVFRRLSVFAGGFTLEASEEVCATNAVEATDVLVLLGGLVEQSLVLAETNPEGLTRYRMLEPIREYALERLEKSGEEERVRACHATHYLALAEEAEPLIKGRYQVAWLDRLEAENDNLRAAIGWSLEAREAQTAARFGWALRMYWLMRARQGEGRLLMEQALQRDGGDLPARARARALNALAVCMYGSEDERLMAISEESVALFRRVGDRHGEVYALGMVGFVALQTGGFDRATRIFAEVLENLRQQGDAWEAAHILNHLAVTPLRRRDYPRAAGYAEEALALTEQTGDRLAAQTALQILAQAAWASAEHEEASRCFQASLVVASELADRVNAAYCMQGLAAVAGARGETRRVVRLLGAAEALLEAAGGPLYAWTDHELHQSAADSTCERLGERAWTAARDEGRAMAFEQAVKYALEDDEASPERVASGMSRRGVR
jgi:predicted ATPase/transcriptional regulator with XRE-family HTH domain